MQEMCFQKGINWNDIGTVKKRGTACYRVLVAKDLTDKVSLDSLRGNETVWYSDFEGEGPRWGIKIEAWTNDTETPIFTQNRTLIELLV